jgi:hypothetical protein
MFDNMMCADCIINVPSRGEIATSPMKISNVDISNSNKNDPQSNTSTEQGNKIFCSICANSILGVEVYSPQVPAKTVQSVSTYITSPLSELHYSIHKPPPNSLV